VIPCALIRNGGAHRNDINARLVPGQPSVPEKPNEITAIPELVDHLAEAKQVEGARVTIDAIGCQVVPIRSLSIRLTTCSPSRATTLEAEVACCFNSAPAEELVGQGGGN
jgi:hypothetical protein